MGVMVTAVCPDLFQRTALANFSIAGDVEMVTDVTEATVVDMVVAAGFKVQVSPLRGGGTMDDDQCYFTHPGRLNATLYTYDAAYGGRHCDDYFEDEAPG